MSVYKLNLLESRIQALETKFDRVEGMSKRAYAFMKACERGNFLPPGWTVDNGNGGVSFRPAGSPRFSSSGAAKDDDLIRQARVYGLARSESNDNCSNAPFYANYKSPPKGDELEEERRELKRMRVELNTMKDDAKVDREDTTN